MLQPRHGIKIEKVHFNCLLNPLHHFTVSPFLTILIHYENINIDAIVNENPEAAILRIILNTYFNQKHTILVIPSIYCKT